MNPIPTDPPELGNGLDPTPIIARLAATPGVQRLPSPKLTLFVKRDVLPLELCQALMTRIDEVRRPSTIADANGDASYRTSETGDLPGDDPAVIETERRIAMLTGLSAAFGEPIQGQRYAVGQEFKQHTDYFEPSGLDYHRYCALSGNRTWTVMLYLNTPEAGGATRFKAVDKMIQPEPGKLVAWSNRRADGSPNPATLHQAMKVRAGVKYVITKWYRELPWRG
ncbi:MULTISPECIES: 2OG-Fe(II) oxygenase [unclassified Sphingomonas]|uniref:prolyl hydroxylase family protein n=1 Tax=unclassified Sphingomonas TaxID=196159 RepID=UPI002864B6EF|nr:2OG-Fe(II) oxygenase [Sphingomonas sp. SORGH_AS_0870]MDR6145606.1 prolyl 4-hydroxylase [Sphingomonas sp. SORGH_AS_0870]